MTITTHRTPVKNSLGRPNHQFWANATEGELHSLDLQELFGQLFCANQLTTEAFLKWLQGLGSSELCEQAASKLALLTAPISYCNEDCDRRQEVSNWALNTIPAAIWIEYRNLVAFRRYKAAKSNFPIN